jgi:hypothetical protein
MTSFPSEKCAAVVSCGPEQWLWGHIELRVGDNLTPMRDERVFVVFFLLEVMGAKLGGKADGKLFARRLRYSHEGPFGSISLNGSLTMKLLTKKKLDLGPCTYCTV